MKRLIEQTLADMDDAIAQSNLSFRTAVGDEPLPFLGDNGKMYRVIQNLVENILKYSLGGTRVYIDAGKEKGEIFVTMKNISAYEMNFEAEEMITDERGARPWPCDCIKLHGQHGRPHGACGRRRSV